MDSPVLELRGLDSVPELREGLLDVGVAAHRRALRFANPKDTDEFVSGRIALWHFAASLLDIEPARLTPDFHCPQCGTGQDHGRPGFLLDGGPAPLALSASRASGWVLLAGVVHPADGLRLGVDLEAISRVGFDGFDDVALTDNEKRFLATVPDRDALSHRAGLWARKEAWLKMTGEGLRTKPSGVDVLDLPGLRDVTEEELPDGLVAALAVG